MPRLGVVLLLLLVGCVPPAHCVTTAVGSGDQDRGRRQKESNLSLVNAPRLSSDAGMGVFCCQKPAFRGTVDRTPVLITFKM